MAESYLVEPDVGFIKDLAKLGGQDLKKCFQCATCSVACPISPDNKPFPRKEMIATSWGLKDKVLGSADIWLCHNCGDCTTLCPRGAKPGDVLAALRAYAVTQYAAIKPLAKAVQDPKQLPILMAIPVAIFLILGFILNLAVPSISWLNFAPVGDHLWQSDYINNYLVDIIMIPTLAFAVISFGLGLKNFVADIHANALASGKTDKKTIDPAGFVRSLIRTVPTIIKHAKFNECGENKDRSTSHMMVLFSFVGLFIVTNCFFIAEWVLHIEGPYSQWSPVKWLGNVSGVALIVGGALMVKKRMDNSDSVTSYWDWSLLGLVLTLGLTGMLTEMFRLGGLFGISAIIYAFHLIAVWSLFAYTPYSKLAHLVYRTTAMVYQEYIEKD
ncbi:MAG: quinone-interacting membrane-bound oxidoreductase complex subunit QmoC [Desulfobacteraceae bacterium]|nr:quinone-interacting membrane-bound oxidoreductase complex subunit QmoC [Desulfobacteraceae bacterium]